MLNFPLPAVNISSTANSPIFSSKAPFPFSISFTVKASFFLEHLNCGFTKLISLFHALVLEVPPNAVIFFP